MSYDCTSIQNFSKKVSNNYNKCYDFATNSGTIVLPEGASECLNKYCPKISNMYMQRATKNNNCKGVDLSAGVF